jgi:hypothetical protein
VEDPIVQLEEEAKLKLVEVEQAPSVPCARWLVEVHVLVEEVEREEAAGLLHTIALTEQRHWWTWILDEVEVPMQLLAVGQTCEEYVEMTM